MSHFYDVSLKALFLREGNGIIRSMLFGGKATELLPTEQPNVTLRRADLVLRTEDGTIHQIEFQTTNETNFHLRMLEYQLFLLRTYQRYAQQTVLYLGRQPMRMTSTYSAPDLQYRFRIVNLRQMEAAPLLDSADLTDNILAFLAKGSPEKALDVVLPRIRALQGPDQDLATGTITLLSGILGLERTLKTKLQEIGMIDVMQNKILGPAILQGIRQGKLEGKQELLRSLLTQKFGPLPAWAEERLAAGSSVELNLWAKAILSTSSLEDLFR
jgi:hypothetical protein